MAARSGQKIKLICLLDILRKETDEEHPLSAGELCDRLAKMGVSAERKAIYGDVDALCEYGYDIVHTRIPKSGYFLASREFELPEIYLLADAVRSANFISPKKSRDLISKLDGMISIYQARRREKGIYMDPAGKSTNEELFYIIDAISTAIAEHKKVELTYSVRQLDEDRAIVKRSRTMKVSPYAMTWRDDHYYLIGNYEKYDNLLQLRIDRMRKVNLTAEKARPFCEVSEYSESFDVADYTKKLFGMQGGEPIEAELRCNRKMFEQVLDRFGENIYIRNVDAETFTFSVNVALSDGLITWIMNYGDSVRVQKPQKLADDVRRRAEEIAALYR